MKKTFYFFTILVFIFLAQSADALYDFTHSFHIHINDPVEMSDGCFYYLSYNAFHPILQHFKEQRLMPGESGKDFYQDAWVSPA